MTTAAMKSKQRQRIRRETPPCVRCGTLKGFIAHDCYTPERISGVPFGFDGKLCKNCYGAMLKARRRALGRSKPNKSQREQVYKIRRVMSKMAKATDVMVKRQGLAEPDRQAMADARRWLLLLSPLPVLDPWFSFEHLTDRAKARLEIRLARKEGRL